MTSLFSLLLVTLGSLFTSCGERGSAGGNVPGKGIHITGALTNCNADSLYVFAQTGNDLRRLSAAGLASGSGERAFDLWVEVPAPGVFLVGTAPQMAVRVVLGEEKDITFRANCQNIMGSAQVGNSPMNNDYNEMIRTAQGHMQNMQNIMGQIRMAQGANPGQIPQLQEQMRAATQQRAAFLEGYMKKGGVVGKVAQFLYLKPYGSEATHARYSDEIHYIAGEFFRGIDLADPTLAYIPNLLDRTSEYATTLSSQPTMKKDSLQRCFDRVVNATPAASVNRKVVLTGLVNGLSQTKSEMYLKYGEMYLSEFPEKTGFTAGLENNIRDMKKFAEGSAPPEISQPTPSGEMLSLASLKGKVVMLDFWASWCRPCRMENPNVVRMYQKYKESGFEVLGVSLDQNKEAWMQAIAQDGLTWKHVSDLGGWKSKPAADYGVTSIPMTFLLDKEGRIIGKNLRGPALEEKLRELFGF